MVRGGREGEGCDIYFARWNGCQTIPSLLPACDALSMEHTIGPTTLTHIHYSICLGLCLPSITCLGLCLPFSVCRWPLYRRRHDGMVRGGVSVVDDPSETPSLCLGDSTSMPVNDASMSNRPCMGQGWWYAKCTVWSVSQSSFAGRLLLEKKRKRERFGGYFVSANTLGRFVQVGPLPIKPMTPLPKHCSTDFPYTSN
jgi:hypothetical protein